MPLEKDHEELERRDLQTREQRGAQRGMRSRTRYFAGRGVSGATSRNPAGISKSAEVTGAAEKPEFSVVISMREASPDEEGGAASCVGAGAALCDDELFFLRPKPPKRPPRALAMASEGLCCELFCVAFPVVVC